MATSDIERLEDSNVKAIWFEAVNSGSGGTLSPPTAVTDFGKVYTKIYNKLYFQDGAGVEHEIVFV